MFTCIACAKTATDKTSENGKNGDEARGCGSPSTREAAKNLSTQIKEVASKFSGLYRQCKPCSGSKGQIPHRDPDGASSSTPAWDFTSSARNHSGVSVSTQSCQVVLEDEDEPKEWMAQVEPGVQITFVSLPNGGNDLKRIRFSREMFDKWEAQRWWAENFDRIMELYNVQRFNHQALHTPPRTDDEPRDSAYTKIGSATDSPAPPSFTPRHHYRPGGSRGVYPADSMDMDGSQQYHGGSSVPGGTKSSYDASRTTTSSRDEPLVSISNASEMETQWVEQDEPGVYITIRQLADGTRELRRVRFSRERFGEVHAKQWWEQNRERIQAQYL